MLMFILVVLDLRKHVHLMFALRKCGVVCVMQ